MTLENATKVLANKAILKDLLDSVATKCLPGTEKVNTGIAFIKVTRQNLG